MVAETKTEVRKVEFKDGTIYQLEVDVGTTDAQVQAAAEKQYADDNAPEINNFAEGTRKFLGQGVLMGWGDEIEAKLRTGGPGIIQLPDELKKLAKQNRAMSNKKFMGKLNEQDLALYNENSKQIKAYRDGIKKAYNNKYIAERNRLRAQGDEFTRQNPKTSLGLELAGGFVVPGGIARTGGKQLLSRLPGAFKTPGAQMVGYGAGYGAGTAEESSDMLGDAATSGVTTLVGGKLLSGTGGLIAPQVSKMRKGAQEFMENRGISLTPGQAKGGAVDWIEQKLGAVIPGIKERRSEAVMDWNLNIANKVLAPLGRKLDKLVTNLPDASRQISKEIEAAYTDATKNLVIKTSKNLNIALKKIFDEAKLDGAPPQVLKLIKKEINYIKGQINRGKNTGGIKDKVAQKFMSNAKEIPNNYFYKGKSVDEAAATPYIKNLFQELTEEVGKQNPISYAKLKNVNAAYGDVNKFNIAIKNKGDIGVPFTPKKLRSANTSGEMNKFGKLKEGAQQNKMLGKEGNIAEDILSTTNPDSGTAGNTILNQTLLGLGGLGAANMFAGTEAGGSSQDLVDKLNAGTLGVGSAAGAVWLLYTKPGQKAVRQYLLSGGAKNKLADFLRKNAPTGGLLSEISAEETGLNSLLGIR